MAKILMVIAPQRFRDEELFVTQAELERAGHEIVIASTTAGECSGSRGGHATATLPLADARAADFDVLVFVGGGSKMYFQHVEALRLAREMDQKKGVVAAICLAPVILANAGLLQGKNATVAGTQAAALERGGARYCGPGVTVDGRIITANAPKASRLFAEKIIEVIES